jgi:hypothetical protein
VKIGERERESETGHNFKGTKGYIMEKNRIKRYKTGKRQQEAHGGSEWRNNRKKDKEKSGKRAN